MTDNDELECLNSGDPNNPCKGPVEYHSTGMGKAFPRCEKHWTKRLETEERINQRYPVHAPSDFDPTYCGERWDDDY